MRPHEVQVRRALAGEVDERNAAADEFTDVRGERRTGKPPAEHADEQEVQKDVRHAGRHDDQKPYLGLPAVTKKLWKAYCKMKNGSEIIIMRP